MQTTKIKKKKKKQEPQTLIGNMDVKLSLRDLLIYEIGRGKYKRLSCVHQKKPQSLWKTK